MDEEQVTEEQPEADPPAQPAEEPKEDTLSDQDIQSYFNKQNENDEVMMETQAEQQQQLNEIQQTQEQQMQTESTTSEVTITTEQWSDIQYWTDQSHTLASAWLNIFLGVIIGYIAVKGLFDSWSR